MGENGAGKSTLIRVLAGVTVPDHLDARLDGAPLALGTPQDAARAGFRFVHQELNIAPTLTVAENIFLGHRPPRRLGFAVNWRELNRRAAEALARFGVTHIDPRQKAARLGTGDRMLMRLASLLVAGEARLFVLDEPTAALTHAESERLFRVIHDLRAQGPRSSMSPTASTRSWRSPTASPSCATAATSSPPPSPRPTAPASSAP
jgi:ribose transport system ATP-binding protein